MRSLSSCRWNAALAAIAIVWTPYPARGVDACKAADALVEEGKIAAAQEAYSSLRASKKSERCARDGLVRLASRCDAARRLLEAGYREEAKTAYESVLKGSPGLECALAGIGQLAAANPCAAADRLLSVGRRDEAKAEYESVLKRLPARECALAGLERLAADARRCDSADAFARNGLEKEARAEYQAILKDSPSARCAVSGLARLEPPAWIRSLSGFSGRVATPFVAALGPVLAVLLLSWLWLRRVHFWKLKLDIDKASPGASGLGAEACEQIMSSIEHELARLTRRRTFARPALIDGPLEPPSLPDLTALWKGASAVWNFLLTLFPPNSVSLSAVLLETNAGPALGLRLVHLPTKELRGSIVITHKDIGATPPERPTQAARDGGGESSGGARREGAGGIEQGAKEKKNDASGSAGGTTSTSGVRDFEPLARAAAAWTCWAIHEWKHHRKFRGKSCREAGCAKMRDAFGTWNSLSYAAARQGAIERTHDASAAERALRVALRYDFENRMALYNFAALRMELRGSEIVSNDALYREIRAYFKTVLRKPQQHRRCLADVLLRMRGIVAPPPESFDAISAFAQFHLGSLEVYRSLNVGDPTEKTQRLERAEKYFSGALEMARSSRGRSGAAELDFLIAHAACLRMLGRNPEAEAAIRTLQKRCRVLPASALLNLACYYSNPVGSDEDMERAVGYFTDARAVEPSMEELLKKDPALRNLQRHLHPEEPAYPVNWE